MFILYIRRNQQILSPWCERPLACHPLSLSSMFSPSFTQNAKQPPSFQDGHALRSQIATSSWGGRRYQPFAFTELGVAMLSSVLRSNTAILVNRAIMKAFVAMRNYIMTTSTITAELSEIRAKLTLLERADEDNAEAVNDLSEDMRKELDNIYEAIAALSVKVPQARRPARPIGFKLPEEGE